MKYNSHLTFQCVIDCHGTHSDAGMPSAILFVKQVKGKIKNLSTIRDQITEKQENKGTAKKL